MYFTAIFFSALFGLQLTGAAGYHSCNVAPAILGDDSKCQEAFDSFFDDSNVTADSPLCTRTCRRLIETLASSCGVEFVS